jgi:hypothetical protein
MAVGGSPRSATSRRMAAAARAGLKLNRAEPGAAVTVMMLQRRLISATDKCPPMDSEQGPALGGFHRALKSLLFNSLDGGVTIALSPGTVTGTDSDFRFTQQGPGGCCRSYSAEANLTRKFTSPDSLAEFDLFGVMITGPAGSPSGPGPVGSRLFRGHSW